ncbi:uncharacterized protein LOC132196787 [Neocloeon triangulifer]|uniref:uncharacterized protein LOC132196787 n=1 Tax=Neocloeon triangulifer TaxID=2078957 RepID=UPI00286F7E5F|nr:uncharacterized protein LOC132196787 [Neocloeon triangulifer]
MNEEEVVERLHKYKEAIKQDVLFINIADKLITHKLLDRDEYYLLKEIPENALRMEKYLNDVLPKKLDGFGYASAFSHVLRMTEPLWLAEKIRPLTPDPQSAKKASKRRISKSTSPRNQSTRKDQESPSSSGDEVDAVKICRSETPKESAAAGKINNNDQVEDRSKYLQLEISKEMIDVVSNDIYVIQKWCSLVHALDMDSDMASLRVKMFLNPDGIDYVIASLIKSWIGKNPKTANLGSLIDALRNARFNYAACQLEETFMTTLSS